MRGCDKSPAVMLTPIKCLHSCDKSNQKTAESGEEGEEEEEEEEEAEAEAEAEAEEEEGEGKVE